ncbi:MAG: GyrI-like domain-containing protein [Candidatus Faecousia sp.]|nr:GyrI-like domain-containing protein [Candidatus Faecousia sp.]
MQNVRIMEIPPMKAAYSGPLTDAEKFEKFNKWFSEYHASLTNELYPRDFMWYNQRLGAQEWFYALPAGAEDSVTDFEIVDLPSGLFAVASCLDADLDQAADWLKTREELLAWVSGSSRFKPYENEPGKAERYPMFHIVSPGRLIPEGISVEDLYLPIEEL